MLQLLLLLLLHLRVICFVYQHVEDLLSVAFFITNAFSHPNSWLRGLATQGDTYREPALCGLEGHAKMPWPKPPWSVNCYLVVVPLLASWRLGSILASELPQQLKRACNKQPCSKPEKEVAVHQRPVEYPGSVHLSSTTARLCLRPFGRGSFEH